MKPSLSRGSYADQVAYTVSFKGHKRTVLVLDTEDHIEDEGNSDTFVNLCFQTCKTIRQSVRFVYVVMDRVAKALYAKILDEVKPDAVVFAAEELARLADIPDLTYKLCMLQGNAVVVIPFRYWASKHYAGPNSIGNALFGYTLRGFVAAAQGHNLVPDVPDEIKHKLVYVDNMSLFKDMYKVLVNARCVALDSETTSLAKRTGNIISLQFGVEVDGTIVSYFLPMRHRETPWSTKDFARILSKLEEWLTNADEQEIVMHGGSFDCEQLMNLFKVEHLSFKLYDTTAGEFLLDENRKSLRGLLGVTKPYRLDVLELTHGIRRPTTQIDKEDRSRMSSYTLKQIFAYGCWDVITLLLIRKRQLRMSSHRLYGYPSRQAFRRTVVEQLGRMLKTYATMQYNGIKLDLNHLVKLARSDGPFQVAMNEIYDNLLATKAGKKANEILLKHRGATGGGLFGSKTKRVLELTKPEHRGVLFFDVMKLEPLRVGKNGVGSTDSAFQKAYAGRYPEVELFRQFNSNLKLKTAFADSLLDIVSHDPDFKADGRVRPGFGFTSVLTGRGSSFGPNAQQVPSRGALSKEIKKNFTVEKGNVKVAADFSAHEVRMSGVISRDDVICSTFKTALDAIRTFRLGPIPNDPKAAMEELELTIDIHIANALRFYGKRIHKKDPLRTSIKNVVFSAIYGAMAKKIAKTTESGELQAAIDTIFKKEKALAELKGSVTPDHDAIVAIKKELAEKREIMERPFEFYLEQAEDAFRRLEKNWHVMFEWMSTTKAEAKKTFVAHYPNGRVRHLWGYLSSDIWAERAMDRRAVNSIIQGFSADIGIIAAYGSNEWVYRNCVKNGIPVTMKLLNIVHDAIYRETAFEQIPLAAYLTEHAMSTIPYTFYRDVFDFEFLVPLGYDVDFGISWDSLTEWQKRPEMLDVIIDDLGSKTGKTSSQIRAVKKDWATIWEYRAREIDKDRPDLMLLEGDRFRDVAHRLNMFH